MNLNENDPKAAAWLRELSRQGHIPEATIDTRSIAELTADDLAPHQSVHLFAGIGGWPYALRLAGWPDDRPVWTGSCPCQPFSAAGKRRGTDDERHLWPEMRRLIAECRPPVIFGEQVASNAGREWLAGVRADLEALGYEVGAADLCAAGVGAPHIRQRLFWVADRDEARCRRFGVVRVSENGHAQSGNDADRCGSVVGVSDCEGRGCGERGHAACPRSGGHADGGGIARGLRNADSWRQPQGHTSKQAGPSASDMWSDYETITFGDGKTRRAKPGLAPLVDGTPARVVRLRGYGNAIVPDLAAKFVAAYLEARVMVPA